MISVCFFSRFCHDLVDNFNTSEEGLNFLLENWHEEDPRNNVFALFDEQNIVIGVVSADPLDANIAVYADLVKRSISKFHCVYVTVEGNERCEIPHIECKITPLHNVVSY